VSRADIHYDYSVARNNIGNWLGVGLNAQARGVAVPERSIDAASAALSSLRSEIFCTRPRKRSVLRGLVLGQMAWVVSEPRVRRLHKLSLDRYAVFPRQRILGRCDLCPREERHRALPRQQNHDSGIKSPRLGAVIRR
jgi:hypothetical protein